VPAENPDLWGAVRLHVWMALAAGAPLTLDDGTLGRLDRGNVLDGTGTPGTEGRLWEDVSCDVLDVSTHLGATAADGVIARSEAGTATIVMADPERRYDPMAPQWPRLAPGMEVLIWAQHGFDEPPDFLAQNAALFLGRAETITEPWSPHPNQRRCTIIATDVVPDLVANTRAELARPIAAGELARDRVARILAAFGPAPALNDTVVRTLSSFSYVVLPAEPSVVVMQATTLPDSAWAELNKVADAEVGFLYVEPTADNPYVTDWVQKVQFLPRSTWQNETIDPVTLPCDVVIGARVTASDGQQRTRVTGRRAPLADESDRLAARDEVIGFVAGGGAVNSDFTFTGATGTYLTYRVEFAAAFYAAHAWPVSQATLLAFFQGLLPQVERTRSFPSPRPLGYTRTDLELNEAEVPAWVAYVLASFQRPRAAVDAVTLRPAKAGGLWPVVLGVHLAVDRVRLEWQPPDGGVAIAVTGRPIGIEHTITRSSWTVTWNLADVELMVSGVLLTEDFYDLLTEAGDTIRLS
jgi:hypothetical protein